MIVGAVTPTSRQSPLRRSVAPRRGHSTGRRGFVELTDGSGEAFLHISIVEAAGHTALESGTTLTVRVGQGAKGPQITEITNVDTSTAEPSRGPPRFGGGGCGGPAAWA